MKLYLWTTPNGQKPLIMLEEINANFELVKIGLNGEQKAPDYVALNPNGRIPTLVDDDVVVFESGAILLYLAEKTGKFLPKETKKRYNVIQWLMFQMGGVGPMLGQLNHFLRLEQEIPYAIERYRNEMLRLFSVVESSLENKDYIAGEYSIADMSLFPWMRQPSYFDIASGTYPRVEKWGERIAARAAVQKAMAVKFT